jgi:hypothetical protein
VVLPDARADGEDAMNLLETLVATRALLTPPEHWTQDAYRRNAKGDKCRRDEAVCWCLMGALTHVSPLDSDGRWEAIKFLENKILHDNIESANDCSSTRHADVLRWLDTGITMEMAV